MKQLSFFPNGKNLSFWYPRIHYFTNFNKNAFQFILAFSIFFISNILIAQTTTVNLTTTGNGTWTVPCGVTSITVEVWGAGGGGQRANGNPSAGGGGSGGGFVRATIDVTSINSINYHVGAGGTGNSGQNGAASWFVNNTTLLAVGGNGAGAAVSNDGSYGTGATAPTSGNIGGTTTSTYGGNGGNASSGTGSGGGGSSAGNTNGNNANNATGGSAPINGYTGANGITSGRSTGNNGGIGAGGSGGRANNNSDQNGGRGGNGQIRITYFNYIPADPGNPTSNSPQCNPPGVTLTRVGTPPAGVTWYWQTAANGTSTANSGATYTVTTSGTYYLRAQNNATGCWSTGAGSRTVTITPPLSGVAANPNPANNATGVCYAGSGVVSSISWGAVTGANSYDVYFGAGSLPGVPNANVTTTNYNVGTLLANTTYFWKIVPKNACGETTGTPINWSFTTSNAPCYCAPATLTDQSQLYIRDVRFLGTLNPTNRENLNNGFATGFQDFTSLWAGSNKPTQAQGQGINVHAQLDSWRGRFKAWVDWNQNGIFETSEEVYDTEGVVTNSALFGFVIPTNQTPGDYRIRIRVNNSMNIFGTETGSYDFGPCEDFTGGFYIDYGEAEDYVFTVIQDCPAKITAVNINAGDGERCGPGDVVISAQGPSGATYNLYTNEFGGATLQSNTSGTFTITGLAVGSYTYWVTATAGGC